MHFTKFKSNQKIELLVELDGLSNGCHKVSSLHFIQAKKLICEGIFVRYQKQIKIDVAMLKNNVREFGEIIASLSNACLSF